MKYQKIIYLCAPYSTKIPFLKWWRFRQVNKRAAQLMDMGYIVFSPISHSHPISKHTKADSCDFEFWVNQDLAFMPMCDEVWILMLWRWKKSSGIKREVKEAERLGKVVKYTT